MTNNELLKIFFKQINESLTTEIFLIKKYENQRSNEIFLHRRTI